MAGLRRALLAASLLVALGCPSAYQRTYEQKTQALEAEAQGRQRQEEAAHAEAQRYAAVVYFAVGSAAVDPDGARELRWFVKQMAPYPQAVVEVRGFADATGSESRNQGLSDERAASVARFLEAEGVPASRLVTEGHATRSPAAPNVTATGRRRNRRVEVTVR
jgi:outer membrane protein OmpA-like peptidoglycan-associated protein